MRHVPIKRFWAAHPVRWHGVLSAIRFQQSLPHMLEKTSTYFDPASALIKPSSLGLPHPEAKS
jgi:hypothetical protein